MNTMTADATGISPALQTTLTATGIGLYSFDPETNVFVVDETCRKLFDIDPGIPLSPEVMLSRIHPDDVPRYWAAAAESVQTGSFACDYRVIHRDGSVRFVSGRGNVYAAEGHKSRRMLGVCVDVTARHALESELKRALERKSEELERSNRDLEQFAYVASHDLKAPLRAIEILVDWLQEDLNNFAGGEVQQNLGLLKGRTARLHRLLDDLMAYSRAGRKPGEIAEVDTRLLAVDLFTLLAPPATMRMEASSSLPRIRAHHAPLEQVLRNLINNAIKHHPTQQGHVRVYAQDTGDELLFAVEDDGAGIPQEYAEKVFQMFQTLQPRDEIEGSGMGLAIVKRIVEWQSGRIWFHGGPGGTGTVFKFTWKKLPGQPADTVSSEVSDERSGKNRAYLAG